jgi:hypothetical protein
VRLISHLNELRGDADDATFPVNGALQQIVHAQFAANLRHAEPSVFVMHGRGASNDTQPLRVQISQSSDRFFGQAVTEILLIGITTQILEGKHRKHDFSVRNLRVKPSLLLDEVYRWAEDQQQDNACDGDLPPIPVARRSGHLLLQAHATLAPPRLEL